MKRKKVRFLELVTGRFIQWHPLESFEVFRWMIRTGYDFQSPGTWGASGVFEFLYGLSCTGAQYYWREYGFYNLRWQDKMQLSFVSAVLQETLGIVDDWRRKFGIALDKYKMMEFHESGYDLRQRAQKSLHKLMSVNQGNFRLKKSPNEYHDTAVEMYAVTLSTNGEQWVATLDYGYDGSSWKIHLAEQGRKPFAEFLVEADAELEKLGIEEIEK